MSNGNEHTYKIGLTALPSAEGKRFTRKKWNIYKVFRKNIHYYHLSPYDRKDVLIESDINPYRGIELVNSYNEKGKNGKIKN